MTAYHVETELVEALREHYSDHHGDARTIVASMLKSSGTLKVDNGQLVVTLEKQSSPKRTRLLHHVCEHLNKRAALYPGSDLTLRFCTEVAT
jgi:DNA-binding transcriptional regulator WhiA